jgi:hypothetical protein
MSYIHAILFNRRGKKLSDIEFLAIKEFGGKVRSNEGTATTATDLATLTANTGKDMYLATAKCSVRGTGSSISLAIVELLINGVVVETFHYRSQWSVGGSVAKNTIDAQSYEFKNIGRKVAAGQIIKLRTLGMQTASAEGYIECFEEDTGASPAI